MNVSPERVRELQSSRPTAPPALRRRIRELAAEEAVGGEARSRARFRLPVRRISFVALPAAAALAVISAGAIGLSRSGPETEAFRDDLSTQTALEAAPADRLHADTQPSAIAPTPGRAQRVTAVLTVEVADAEAVSRAAQDALDLTRRLGGYVVSASVATGDEGSAALTVRVPVSKVQEAIAELSALGRIASQQVTIDDLQVELDELERRRASVRAQLLVVAARLESETLDVAARARLEARRQTLREELRSLSLGVAATSAEARMATLQLTVVTPGAQGVVPVPSRLDRTLDEALNVLVWEGVVALAVAIVLAPLGLVALVAWLGHRLYRRRADERLLAA